MLLLDFEWFHSFIFSISHCIMKHSNEGLLCVSAMLTCLFPDIQSCQAKSYFPKHVCVLVAGASKGSCWQPETDFPIKHINKALWELTCLDWVLPLDSLRCECQLDDKCQGHLGSFIKRQKNKENHSIQSWRFLLHKYFPWNLCFGAESIHMYIYMLFWLFNTSDLFSQQYRYFHAKYTDQTPKGFFFDDVYLDLFYPLHTFNPTMWVNSEDNPESSSPQSSVWMFRGEMIIGPWG